jgi:hypothetical protein
MTPVYFFGSFIFVAGPADRPYYSVLYNLDQAHHAAKLRTGLFLSRGSLSSLTTIMTESKRKSRELVSSQFLHNLIRHKKLTSVNFIFNFNSPMRRLATHGRGNTNYFKFQTRVRQSCSYPCGCAHLGREWALLPYSSRWVFPFPRS